MRQIATKLPLIDAKYQIKRSIINHGTVDSNIVKTLALFKITKFRPNDIAKNSKNNTSKIFTGKGLPKYIIASRFWDYLKI
jgi:hypothetical protein